MYEFGVYDLIGIGVLFGLTFFLNRLTVNNGIGFMVFLMIVSSLLVKAGVLDIWVFILCVVILFITLGYLYRNNNAVNEFMLFVPFGIMGFLTLISVFFGNSFGSASVNNIVDNRVIVDGVVSTFEIEQGAIVLSVDAFIGATAWIIGIIALAGIIGLNVLGSGLTDWSVRVITIGTFYGATYVIFSLLSANLIISIELIGVVLYAVLTMFYAFGVFKRIIGVGS